MAIRLRSAPRGVASCSKWFHLQQQGWKTELRALHAPLARSGELEEASWVGVQVCALKTSIFSWGSAERLGPLSPNLLFLSTELWLLLLSLEVIWNTQALVSCQEMVVSRLCAIISFFVPFSHWWWISTFFGLFSSCCQDSLSFKQISLSFPMWKRTVLRGQVAGVSSPDSSIVPEMSPHILWLLWGFQVYHALSVADCEKRKLCSRSHHLCLQSLVWGAPGISAQCTLR